MYSEIINGNTFELVKKIPDDSVSLLICDGPFGITEFEWDKIDNIQEFNLNLIKMFAPKLKPGGSLYLFGKPDCLDFMDYRPFLKLNNKIVWYQPARLSQGKKKFTNNYDLIYYFSRGPAAVFNLDDIRVPQNITPEHMKRCENVPSVTNGIYTKTKYNENGKNCGDVWSDIKQLTYKSHELISRELLNTIQKPEKLIERLVRASSNPGDFVLDPFAGAGTVLAVCEKLKRKCVGFEINPIYTELIQKRLNKIRENLSQNLEIELGA